VGRLTEAAAGSVAALASALAADAAPPEPAARPDGLVAAFRQLSGGDSLHSAAAAVLTQGCAALAADEGLLLLAGEPLGPPPAHAAAAPAVEVTWLDHRHGVPGEGPRPVAHIGAAGVQGRLGTRPADQARAAGAVSARQAVTHDSLPGGSEVWCPLLVKGRAVGALAFRRQAGPFAPGELSLVEILAAGAALAADRLRVYDLWSAKLGQAEAAHEQLLRYADDLRTTFAAERRRAGELSRALGALDAAYRATVRALASATEEKDGCTGGHLARVSALGMVVAREFDPALADTPGLEYAFLLHDVGKIGIPDAILTKPGPLTPAERDLMREHPAIGLRILAGVPGMDVIREVVYCHHERWDGDGYPRGLAGDAIPRAAQVFSAVDAFDAMTTDRPYSAAIGVAEALARLSKASGSQLAPDAVRALVATDHGLLEHIRATTPPPSGRAWPAPGAGIAG
jgi:ribonuclease P protein subunit RPR2